MPPSWSYQLSKFRSAVNFAKCTKYRNSNASLATFAVPVTNESMSECTEERMNLVKLHADRCLGKP